MWTKPATAMLQFLGFIIFLFGLIAMPSHAGVGAVVGIIGALMVVKGGIESRRRMRP